MGHPFNPQTFDRYGYALGNPARFTDPTGQDPVYCEFVTIGGEFAGGGCDYTAGSNDYLNPYQQYDYNCLVYPAGCGYYNGMPVPNYPAYGGGGYTPTPTPPPPPTVAQPPGVPQLPGMTFTQTAPGTWSFTSQNSFQQTLSEFEQAGFVPDYIDPLHPGYYNLRDQTTFCSVHIDILESSGQTPGQPTVGTAHIDTVNPYGGLGSQMLLGPGSIAFTFIGHEASDVGGFYPSSSACQ
jgi:hypothetical protein